MRKIEALMVNVEQNSGIEIVGDVHTFMVGGTALPQRKCTYMQKLKDTSVKMTDERCFARL